MRGLYFECWLVDTTLKEVWNRGEDTYNNRFLDERSFKSDSIATRSDRNWKCWSSTGRGLLIEKISAGGEALSSLLKGSFVDNQWYVSNTRRLAYGRHRERASTIMVWIYTKRTVSQLLRKRIARKLKSVCIGFCKVLESYTKEIRIWSHRLLIIDGHGTYLTPQFDKILKPNAVKTCMDGITFILALAGIMEAHVAEAIYANALGSMFSIRD